MFPVKTPDTNATFVLEGCGDLPATKCHDAQGTPYVESCWQLTPEELAVVQKTGRIYLLTMGDCVLPVCMSVQSALEKEGES